MRRIKLIGRFLIEVPWTPILVGAALAFPVSVAILQRGNIIRPRSSAAWELALGVLLGGLVGWVFPVFIESMRVRWGLTRPLRRLLNPFHNNDLPATIFLATLYPSGLQKFEKNLPYELSKTQEVVPLFGMPWVLAENDGRALGYVMAILARAGKTENLAVVRDDTGINITDTNMICIGSSKSNHKTKQIIETLKGINLEFEWQRDRIVINQSQRTRDWTADEDHDYALLAKVPNVFEHDRYVLIVAGISHVGTAGAGYYLWHKWRDIEARTIGKSFIAVLKVRRSAYKHVELDFWVDSSDIAESVAEKITEN